MHVGGWLQPTHLTPATRDGIERVRMKPLTPPKTQSAPIAYAGLADCVPVSFLHACLSQQHPPWLCRCCWETKKR
jgi:hypothetical protein